jgi:hypothetical protein
VGELSLCMSEDQRVPLLLLLESGEDGNERKNMQKINMFC